MSVAPDVLCSHVPPYSSSVAVLGIVNSAYIEVTSLEDDTTVDGATGLQAISCEPPLQSRAVTPLAWAFR